MKNLLVLLMLAFQITGIVYLVRNEGWVSGVVFLIFTMIFFGLMARVAELANKLWSRIFGKR